MNQKQPYLQSIKIIFLGLVIALGTSYVFAAFTAPTQAPPNCTSGNPGCDAPINVSKNSQSKLGQLLINTSTTNPIAAVGLKVFGESILQKIQITGVGDASNVPGVNKVLTSNEDGKGTWKNKLAVSSTYSARNPAKDGYEITSIMEELSLGGACFLTRVETLNTSDTANVILKCSIEKSTTNWFLEVGAGSGEAVFCQAICIH